MRKRTGKLLSLLLTFVLLLSLLPAPAQAGIRDPFPTTLAFTTKPQSGSSLKTEGYTYTWALNKAADLIVLEIQETNRLTGATDWKQLKTLTGTSGSGTLTCPTVSTQISASGLSTYRISAGILGATAADNELAVATFTVTWTDQTYTVTVNGGTGSGEYAEGASVTIAANEPGPGWEAFKEWDGADGLTFTEGSATTATATFTMPAEAVELTAVYQRVKPDTTPVRPEGRGTVVQPFRIGTVGELYWFAGFVNGTITADDISMSVNEVHAILINDITVNPDLLTKDYALNASGEDTALLAAWEPINPANGFLYTGTFDGQGHTISGIYCAPQPDGMEYGFFTSLSANYAASGCIRDLTLADSYFCAPARNYSNTGAFVGWLDSGATVENCHFDGTVTTAITADSADKENYDEVSIAGIAGFAEGEIRDCTAKGLISGYGKEMGGIAASVGNGKVIYCVNEATVENTRSSGYYYFTGGIAGRLGDGIIQDCRNKGDVSATMEPAGIVSYVEDAESSVIRCWNEGNIVGTEGAGIVVDIMGGSVKNCYNAGSATYAGIVGTPYGGSSVTYCHNVGTITDGSDKSIIGDAHYSITVTNCYYLADSETDSIDGTTCKTAAQFADGTVSALLNSGDNAGNWRQGDGYPVLAQTYTLTVNGGTGGGEYGEGAVVTVTAEVPDGMVFAGWDGLEGLSETNAVSTTFLMPGRNVELTAKFTSIAPTRPEGSGTTDDPFRISTAGELYWFAGFVNGTIEKPADITVSIDKACAMLMNDITVNPDLLADDYTLNVSGEDTDLLAAWTPIDPANGYKGTFDGQGHTISGIYCAPQATENYRYGGFFRTLYGGGCIRDLTLADSYFRAPAKNSAYTGAFAGYIASYCTVENCHFDGTVTTAITADSSDEDKETYPFVYIAGIAGDVVGEIRDCTARGLISGYGSAIGGIASYVYNGEVAGCVNEATVETPNNSGDIGGIVGRLYKGIIRDCRNKGNVIGRSSAGIVSDVEDTTSAVIRCWNEGDIEGSYGSGIVLSLMGSVKNCYNTGSVDEAGIAGTAYSGSSVAYCHNVGEITGYMGAPICRVSSGSNITIENCYYLADSETDSVDGTTCKTAAQFADGTVLALLNSGDNAGNWRQGDGYPVLAQTYTVTVNGGTGSGEYGEGASVTVTAEVPDGYVFAGWDGLDGLSGEDGQPARDTAATTFLMPGRDVELTAQFVSTTPVRPANGNGTPENPFEITNLSELLWFRDFVNYDIAAPADCARPYEACAKLMNDITVNYALLGGEGSVRDDTKLEWTPIGKNDSYSYKGTFDGQGYAISGLYHGMGDNTSSVNSETYCLGLFGVLGSGGVIRDLTVKDSYLAVPYDWKYARVGGIVGSMGIGDALVENCRFDGIITTPNELSSTYRVGGIAGFCAATIRNCTSKGLITGYFTHGGGIAGLVARDTAGSGLIFGCRNEAAVRGLHPYTDPVNDAAGGIVGEIRNGTIRDCSNTGRIDAGNYQGGIAGYADGNEETPVTISRCWNEGEADAGIVQGVYRNVHIKNCYNTGRVYAGIVHSRSGAGNTITYCHNVGELYNDSGTLLYPIAATDGFTIENCYYLANEELDSYDGTTALSADRFSRQDLQMVTKLLNSKNAGNWKQGPDYPVLTDVGPTTIRGVCESYYVTRSSIPEVVVEDYYGPGATLVVAQYVDGCLVDLRLVAVTGDATIRFSEDAFASVEGSVFIAYLYDAGFSPICASAPLKVVLR